MEEGDDSGAQIPNTRGMGAIPTPVLPDKADERANKEALAFQSGENLESEAKANQHERSERLKNNISQALIVLFWLAILAFLAITVSWLYHLLIPPSYHYLSEAQLDKIQTVITAIVFSSAVRAIGREYYGSKSK
jgi:hypothetical protein